MKKIPSTPFLRRLKPLAIPAAQLALSFLLTAGCLSGGYAPFSLALVAAAGTRLPGLLCLAGAGCGALVFLDFPSGLRHVAAAILIFAANTAFCDTRFYRRDAFRPAMACAMMLLVQSIYLLHRSAEQWIWCLASLAVLACAVWCWRSLWQDPDKNAFFAVATALAVATQPVILLGPVSLGRILASLLVLWIALEWPTAQAVVWSAGLGLLLDLVPVGPRFLLGAVYGCAAALTALCRPWPRIIGALAFCLSAGASAILFKADIPEAALYEALAASVLFLPLGRRVQHRPARLKAPSAAASPAPESPYLRQSAAALRELYDSFFRGAAPTPPENPSVLFDRAAEQVCRGCVLCSSCWHQNYNSTYNAFNDACPKLLQRGQALAQDFPLYFSSRCVHFTDFLTAVNGELKTFLLRRQYRQRLLEVRQQAQDQYQQLGEALASTAVHAVSNVTAPMGYRIGSSLRPKEGQQLCGDHLATFEVGSTLYLLLSDGMGSGESAHRESAMTARLLQQFLTAGIDPGPALKTLNGAMRLRSEDGGGFTTIDLLALQRTSGTATVYKYGAAPSYVKRTGSVSRITGQSLPAGLQGDPPEVTRLHLPAGSYFVMISDGIADETNDEWLQNLLAGWQGRDVNALVSLILSESRTRKGLSDDCAVLILQLPMPGENEKTQV